MNFRNAIELDADRCLELYNKICDWEELNGIQCCWEKGLYPTMENIQEGLAEESLFVLEDYVDGKFDIVACGIINSTQPSYFDEFTWNVDATPDEVLVLHTFAVDVDYQHRGYGTTFMHYYQMLAKERNCKALRLDTLTTNIKSQFLYQKLGFKTIGYWQGDPNNVQITLNFIALEKEI